MRKPVSIVYLLGASLALAACGDDDNGDDTVNVDAAPPGDDGTVEVALAGENEVPPVATPASGVVTASLEGDDLEVTGEFSNLEANLLEVSGSSAHIHQGDVDEAGPIVFNLEVTSSDGRSGTLAGTFELSDEQVSLFERGLLYVNVHTDLNPGGEIRGQLSPDAPSFGAVDAVFDAELSPESETDDVDSDASGTATAIVRGREVTLSGQFSGLTSPLMAIEGSPAHVHDGPPGEDGPIVFPIVVSPDDDRRGGRLSATGTLTDAQLAAMEAGGYYINVHSEMYPSGEIRGQITRR